VVLCSSWLSQSYGPPLSHGLVIFVCFLPCLRFLLYLFNALVIRRKQPYYSTPSCLLSNLSLKPCCASKIHTLYLCKFACKLA
jgi:hypothetical protein